MPPTPTAEIIPDDTIADGELRGFSADGRLIISMQYMPVFRRLSGDENDPRSVTAWRVSHAGARRIAAISAWNAMRGPMHPTAGNA